MKLTKEQCIILTFLDEEGGWTTGQIAKKTKVFERLGGHISSAWIRFDLLRMKEEGLVRAMDDQKPICWVRTKAGSEILMNDLMT